LGRLKAFSKLLEFSELTVVRQVGTIVDVKIRHLQCERGKEKTAICSARNEPVFKYKGGRGFTLIELLVVVLIISLLLGVLIPAVKKVKHSARAIKCMNNQRNIVAGVTLYAINNNDKYPDSVATIGAGRTWNWQEPMMMTACQPRDSQVRRSMSEYLRRYIEDARMMYCPNAPGKYKYLEAAWAGGDAWDNPETEPLEDPVYGTYCFYWNYLGVLGGKKSLFWGPRRLSDGRGWSKLLVSDYFGYDHWRSPGAYGSSERFKSSTITPGTQVSSAYWFRQKEGKNGLNTLRIKLHAAYTDEHVESYSAKEVATMKVSMTPDGSVSYPNGIGPGYFYLPRDALR
jgi:prepilin-type N-terminal cleavage/methylation domain-containing protein